MRWAATAHSQLHCLGSCFYLKPTDEWQTFVKCFVLFTAHLYCQVFTLSLTFRCCECTCQLSFRRCLDPCSCLHPFACGILYFRFTDHQYVLLTSCSVYWTLQHISSQVAYMEVRSHELHWESQCSIVCRTRLLNTSSTSASRHRLTLCQILLMIDVTWRDKSHAVALKVLFSWHHAE